MTKKLCFLFVCYFYGHTVYAQFTKDSLRGIWQADKVEVTSMYWDTYHFFDNGRFVFKPNEYNGLNRIISIVGKYTVSENKLYLTPDSTEELIGGYPARSEITTLSDTWEIRDGKAKMVACKKKIKQTVIIKALPNEQAIFLDQQKYYRVEK
jgi:hypothetical protein